MQDHIAAIPGNLLRGIIAGTVFVFTGLAACSIAAMRRQSGMRAILWLGLWSALYGARPLASALAAVEPLPLWLQAGLPYLDVVNAYFIAVLASLAFFELTAGAMRLFLNAVILVGTAIGAAGIALFVLTGSNRRLIVYNEILVTGMLLAMVIVLVVPGLSRRYLVLPNRGVLAAGTLFFAVEALYVNLARPFGLQLPFVWGDLGFAALLFSLGYSAMQIVSARERDLLSLERELAIAREIQTSILPAASPELSHLNIATAYRPMTAVAGDFFDFIAVDQHRAGFLVADVSGHGVPAALIAGMIKVALQAIVPCAHDPREVLRGLNRILSQQLHKQFVTASYLWLDTEKHKALYSAAGHPPLLRWRESQLERIESNGLLFGVSAEPDYPVFEMSFDVGDRFLMYTDGMVEPENARGESFGDCKLEEVMRDNQSRPPAELIDQLLAEVQHWQSAPMAQQDDITLIVIDAI